MAPALWLATPFTVGASAPVPAVNSRSVGNIRGQDAAASAVGDVTRLIPIVPSVGILMEF